MAEDIIGKSLGRYHVIEKLGQGGMAVVYKALDTTLDRYVAIKVILPHAEYSDQLLARFNREAHTLAKLTHPNILKIFDYGEYENHPYLVMEFIPEGTLKDWLTGQPIPWQKSAQLLSRVARSLETAHSQGVIHRDVKPANILMANGKDPLLADFGIAKLIEGNEEVTQLTDTGAGIGTPDYMAPEQADGDSDERSDIYALGVIFYQMVTGRLPYEADTPMGVMLKKMTEPLPRPTHFVQEIPAFVENVLLRALAPDPHYRYTNMGEFADALERLTSKADTIETLATEAGTGVAEKGEDPNRQGSQFAKLMAFAKETSWVVPTGIIVVIFIAFSTGIYLWPGLIPVTGPVAETVIVTSTSAQPTKKNSSIPILDQPSEDTPTPKPIVTPTTIGGGKWIAFNSRMDGDADIYLIDANGDNLTQVTSSSAHDLYPSWSPDGKRIVYQTNEGEDWEIAIIDISSKRVTKVTENTCSDWAPVWSPDGEWIAFYSDCDGDRNIYKIHPDGTKPTQLTHTSGSNSWFPAWSPDGRKITFTSNRSGSYHIYVMNADGSNLNELAEGCISYFSPDGKQILFGVYCDDTDDLLIMNEDGTNKTALTDGYECRNATWSPDGTQIVFQLSKTTKEGPYALYRMLLNKPEKADWILIADYDVNGGSPAWQP